LLRAWVSKQLAIQELLQRVAQIGHQVVAISHLHGFGRTASCGIGIATGPIMADQFDSWMSQQLSRDAFGRPIC
jgi:class 3 adenylate cyclase